jgi:predicted nucleic acid-binding protein
MNAKSFVDTNVLVYAATAREDAPEKYRRAKDIVAYGNISLSTQVIGEFVNTVQNRRKMSRPLTIVETMKWLDRLFKFPLVVVDRAVVESAMMVQQRYQLSYWDSQIVAAAERSGAEVLYSEDMNHGQLYGAVRCENPFHLH